MKTRQISRDPKLFRALHYFEAVARHGSIAVAAQEVGISASAISHQLRGLAASLGEDLIVKNGRGIALTEVGKRLAQQLAGAFSDIDSIVVGVVGAPRQSLRLAVCSSFGPAWIAPRLPEFASAHPEIDIELRLYVQYPDQSHTIADVMITAQPVKPGFKSVPLFDEMLVAVQKAGSGLPDPRKRHRLITTDPDAEVLGNDWQEYCAATGMRREDFSMGDWVKCTHYLLALELAKAGMGVALVPDFLAAEPLATGLISYFDPRRIPSGRRYQLCFKEGRDDDPAIRALARWMKTHAAGKILRFPRAPFALSQSGFPAI